MGFPVKVMSEAVQFAQKRRNPPARRLQLDYSLI